LLRARPVLWPDGLPAHRAGRPCRARSALTNALTEELISKNVAARVRVRSARKKVRAPWSVDEARKAAGELWADSDFVFTTRTGSPIEPRNFNRSFANRSDRASVRRIRLHDTRHTCGSLLAALDVHPRIAMQILRHSKIAITMEVYTHVPSEATRRALKRLGKHLGTPEDPKK
jgi:integrase